LAKALYGTLQAALLFWQNLSTQLQEWEFEINPYDFCVANKTIDGKQCTIVWHVDDLKISHMDPHVVTTILNLLDAKYGQERVGGERAPVTTNRGKINDYLGMILDYSEPGCVKVAMTENLKKILDEMPEEMDGTATTSAADYLFTIVEGIELLDEETSNLSTPQSQNYYSSVNVDDQISRQQLRFSAREYNNQPSMTSTNYLG
jgi:hypothetical protein